MSNEFFFLRMRKLNLLVKCVWSGQRVFEFLENVRHVDLKVLQSV